MNNDRDFLQRLFSTFVITCSIWVTIGGVVEIASGTATINTIFLRILCFCMAILYATEKETNRLSLHTYRASQKQLMQALDRLSEVTYLIERPPQKKKEMTLEEKMKEQLL